MLNTAKLIIYELILLLAKIRFTKQSTENDTIILIKTDELGDYILFRNYISSYLNLLPPNKKIIFVGNQLWKNLFEQFDKHPSITQTIWINKHDFKSKMLYRFKILKQIRKLPACTAINLVYSRTRRYEDAIASASIAPTKIAYSGNRDNALSVEIFLNKKLYSQLVNLPIKVHDFLKHQQFFAQLLTYQIELPELAVPIINNSSIKMPQQSFVLIFPGSGKPEKIWETAKFVEVAQFIVENLGFHICLCGSKADVPHAQNFIKNISYTVTDYCGKTNMIEVIQLIQHSQFTLSIDTGSVHLSAACNIPSFAIYNGIHYGRFAPYPSILKKNIYPIYPDDVEKQLLRKDFETIVPGNYNDVSAEKVIASIKKSLIK